MACACMAVNCRTGQASLWVHNPRAQSAGKSSFWRVGEGRVLGCEKKKPCAQGKSMLRPDGPPPYSPPRPPPKPENDVIDLTLPDAPAAPAPAAGAAAAQGINERMRAAVARAAENGARRLQARGVPASRMHRLVKTLLMSVLVCAMHRSVGEHRLGIRGRC